MSVPTHRARSSAAVGMDTGYPAMDRHALVDAATIIHIRSYSVIMFLTLEINECHINNGGCEHICTNTLGSFQFSCRNGYRLSSNGQTCNYKNCHYIIICPKCDNFFTLESYINNGGCQDICTNTLDSFKYSCRNGYQLTNNGQTCDGKN